MKTTDLFKVNRSAQRLNESLEKTFGKRLDLASFDLPKLEDARNKLRTQLSQARGQSGFNENLENEAVAKAQFMLDAINAEIAEREEFIADPHVADVSVEEAMDPEVEEFLTQVAKSGDDAYDMIYDGMGRNDAVGAYLQDMANDVSREIGAHPDDDIEDIIYRMADMIDADYGGDDDEGGDTDDGYALASAGHGSDEDYGSFGYDESQQNEYFFFDTPKGKDRGPRDHGSDELERRAKSKPDLGGKDARDYKDAKKKGQYSIGGPKGKLPEDQVSENNAENLSVTRVNQKQGQLKITAYLRKKMGLPNNAPVYFDDADLVWGSKTIVPDALVDDELTLGDLLSALEQAVHQNPIGESAPPGAKAERMVKHIKKGYAKDGKLTDKEKGIAYATAWKQHNKEKNESTESGEDMTKLQEGEVQQASAIVTAKTMVDRVSRWIEELSGMENDTLLQLGDSIRDEMSQEQAKNFISAVAPAIQQALENLKQTRETLATGVRTLTGEEQGAEMLGGETEGGDELGAAEPDAMNMGDEMGPPEEGGEDEFAAAEPAAGGVEAAGREQRESIEYSNRLLRVLAG